ncbi:hypothetical protein F4804DRAFT_325035 [Jackrogersella minutella]|nr:hypothetical protein F4804DRAFT_325035 [Jackrogersella minutella]
MSSLSKSWECSFPGCGKKFSRKEHLNRHNLGHNSEPQYKCHVCGRRYARSDVFKRHVKQHAPQKLCLPCGERNTQCDGNLPCGACVSSWTNCRWADSDVNHGPGNEQATVTSPDSHPQTPWFPPNSEAWIQQSYMATPPYSSVPSTSVSDHQIQDADVMDSVGYTPPESNIDGAGAELVFYNPSNNPQHSPQSISPVTSQQQTISGSPESAGVTDFNFNFDRSSPVTKRLVELFFAEFHPYWAILHAPTFDIDKAPTVLLASMMMLASWLEGGSEHQKLAPIVFDEVNKIRTDLTQPLYLLQATLLYTVYATSNLSVEGMMPRALNLIGWLISTCRYLGIFSGQYSCHEMADQECGCPFIAWSSQEQLNRLAFAVLRVDAYLSILLDHPPSVRYQELYIPLPKSRQLWAACNEDERRKLQWNEPAGREKALFSFFMRDALDPTRVGSMPYCLTDVDYHLSTCATQTHIWEAARQAHSSMSDEIVEETDPHTFVKMAHPHLDLWRDKRRGDCDVLARYFAGEPLGEEHLLSPFTFTLMYMSNLKLHAPLNAMRARGYYHKSRPGADIPTRKPRAHLHSWVSSGCPRSGLWYASQVCRIFAIESGRSGGSRSRARQKLNPLLMSGVLMSAIMTCSYMRHTRMCGYCRSVDPNGPVPAPTSPVPEEDAVDLFSLSDHDPVLLNWRATGAGVPYWGTGDNCIPVCACRMRDIAAWFREAFEEDEDAQMEFVVFLAELSRET